MSYRDFDSIALDRVVTLREKIASFKRALSGSGSNCECAGSYHCYRHRFVINRLVDIGNMLDAIEQEIHRWYKPEK